MAINRRTAIRNMFIIASVKCVKMPFILIPNKSSSGDKNFNETVKHHIYVKPISLRNQYLEMHFDKQEDRLSLVSLVNLLSGHIIPIKSDDFSIDIKGQNPLTAKDFVFKDGSEEQTKEDHILHFNFFHHSKNIGLIISYQLGNNDFFVRRQLALTTGLPLALRQVNVWELSFDGACSFQEIEPPQTVSAAFGFAGTKGFGLPVFMEDSFWGIEYPAGYNQYHDGMLALTHFPGRTITSQFLSKKAVLGVSEPKAVSSRFKQYVKSILATPPSKNQLFIDFNTWTTLMPATERNSLALIELFHQKLFKPYRVSFESFTIDDGWDNKNSLWDINRDRFPDSFSPLLSALQPMNTKLGLWLSPSSGYEHAPWLASQGYPKNGSWDWFMCQSDPRYSTDLTKRVTELTKTYGLDFFKFDGFCAICNATDHPYHLPGNYSKEANVDAYINLLTEIRKVQPDIYLDPTSGMWLSPWWLQYANSVYGDMYDGVPPAIAPTPVPGYGHFITRDAIFLKRIREHPGFPPNAIEHLGIYTPDYNTMYDEIMAVIGRGSRLLTLYLNPDELLRNDRDWKFLAQALKWARNNASVLWQMQIILGDPLKREPYGYSHFQGERGILALYNPFIESRTVTIPLNADSGWIKKEALWGAVEDQHFVVRIVYPYQQALKSDIKYGQSINLRLAGHETVIIQIDPLDPKDALLIGVRYNEISRNGRTIRYNIFGRPGESKKLSMAGLRNVKFNFENSNTIEKDSTINMTFPGKAQYAGIHESRVALETKKGKSRLFGNCIANIPEGSVAKMHILFSPVVPSDYRPTCIARINGSPVKITFSHPNLTPPHIQLFAELPISDWYYISFEVPCGKNEISFSIDAPINALRQFRAEVGWWLWMEHPLQMSEVAIEYDKTLPSSSIETIPVPVRINLEREIITIQPNQVFTIGENPVASDAPVVYLDEILPCEVAMSQGQLQLNKSFNRADLIIAGKEFARGLGTHAYGRIRYNIAGKNFKNFKCFVGLNEDAGNGTVIFEVWVDKKKIFTSASMNKKDHAKEVDLDIQEAASMELRTLGGTDSDDIKGTYGDWCEARLLH